MGTRIRSTRVGTGRNAEVTSERDDKYVRCSRCGFICNTDRDVKAPDGSKLGWGVTTEDDSYTAQDGSTTLYYGDPTVTGGCPFCGTYRYNK